MSKLIKSFENELNEKAQNVIKSAQKNNIDGVIEIFENLCLPFNGENLKRKLFEEIFTLAEINHSWDNELGIIILSKKRTHKTIVSHMDLIAKFNTGFANNKTYEIKEDKLYGALDNTFTNAVLINSILNNKHNNTSYLFTLDEETTQKAIKGYMKRFGNQQFIINLDITNEGMDNNMAIEYDEPSWEICKQINTQLDNPFFTTDRVCDDLDEVIKANGKGFSYCLPTAGNIHSYGNYTYLNKIEPYMSGLEYLIHELSLDKYNHNIKHLKIHKAIKHDNFKDFKEKDIKPDYSYVNPYKNSSTSNIDMVNQLHSYERNIGNNNTNKVNSLNTLILEITKDYDKKQVKTMKRFLDEFNLKKDFTLVDFNKYFNKEELLFTIWGYDIFEEKHNSGSGIFKINKDIIKETHFKIWEMSSKYKSMDSLSIFEHLFETKKISYSDLISFEKKRDTFIVDDFIDKMIAKKLIASKKDNTFKIS